jgi:argininosuccinate lyase
MPSKPRREEQQDMKLWGGRTSKPLDEGVHRLNASLPFDRRLYAEDIEASQAWAEALASAGILTSDELKAVSGGLQAVAAEFEAGSFAFDADDEDIHTAVERRLTELVGDPGRKLHTGRSRNDQVATDFRLWVMHACDRLAPLIADLAKSLGDQAQSHLGAPMPGYTHLQPAQPVTWGHWCLSHAWPLLRDRRRVAAVRRSSAWLPLGSGALAGTSLDIDRVALAERLGFVAPIENSLDAVSDRDFALEFLFAASVLAVHLSRLAEQLVIFASREFGFVKLDEAFTTGSSLMPQKRNPDPLELARGKSGRLIGHLTGLLASLKALPSAYDKDLQEDKEPVFDAFDTLAALLPPLAGLVGSLEVDEARLLVRVDSELMAADLADYLVGKGVPFRQAHALVSRVYRRADELGVPVENLPLAELQAIEPSFDDGALERFAPHYSVQRRSALGGTSAEALEVQVQAFLSELSEASK